MKRKRRRTKTGTTYFVITNFLEVASKIKNRIAFIRTDPVLKHGVCDLKEVRRYGRRSFIGGIQKGI